MYFLLEKCPSLTLPVGTVTYNMPRANEHGQTTIVTSFNNLPAGQVIYNNDFPEEDRIGVVANFSCDDGFILYGSKSATCNSRGHWIYDSGFPNCIGK